MKNLAYALAGCILILAAPMVLADDPQPPPQNGDGSGLPPYCLWFSYTLEPPHYELDPDCLLPPGT